MRSSCPPVRRRWVLSAAMCLLASGLCAPAPARAADSAFVGVLAIALEDGVAKQLGL